MDCFRYLDFKSFEEVDRLTVPEYNLLMNAVELKQFDLDYRNHLQAFLNFAVQARKKVGKNKSRPVFTTFEKFFNHEKFLKKIRSKKEEQEQRYSGIGKFLKKGE